MNLLLQKAHLVDHRRRNQEGEGHPQRYPRLDETDEQGDRRAGAKWRDHSEQGRHNVADVFPLVREDLFRALRRELGADDGDEKDDGGEQQNDLKCIVDEEVQRTAEVGFDI